MAREDVIGRANVEDTPELNAYYEQLAEYEAGALWTVANDIEPWFPAPKSVPTLWKYQQLRPLVVRSSELVTPENSGRRVVMLLNPGRRDISACVGLLYSGLQIVQPGESTSAHKHMASALRFIMEGNGAYTVVDGERMELGARDFVITPNGTWHDHGHAGTNGPCIWQDGLDIPLVNAMDANFYAVHPNIRQETLAKGGVSFNTYAGGTLLPTQNKWDRPYSPLLHYRWDQSYEALQRMAKVSEGSPYDGIIMEYANPLTGKSVMPTMGANLQMLRPGEATRAHRHTGSVMYNVAKGRGYSIIAGKRFDWEEKDIFCVPSWAWHEHVNLSASEDAVLFSFNDFPTIKSLAFYAEEAYPDNGGHQPLSA